MKFLMALLVCCVVVLPALADGGVKDKIKENSVNIFFDFDSSTLSEASVQALEKMVAKTKTARLVVLIFGNTDEVGSRLYNLELGDRRAAAVRDKLKEFGIKDFQIFTASYGEEKPVAPAGAVTAHRQYNRRADVVPLVLEGEQPKNRIQFYGGVGPFLLHKVTVELLKEYKIKQSYNAVFGLGYSRTAFGQWSLGVSAFSNLTFLLTVGYNF